MVFVLPFQKLRFGGRFISRLAATPLQIVFVTPIIKFLESTWWLGLGIEQKGLHLPQNVLSLIVWLALKPIFEKNFLQRYGCIIDDYDFAQ